MMAAGPSRQHDFLDRKVFKDPIHGQISLPPILIKIVDTKQFQRLRNIKQLSTVYHVYPGASHNRFEHSIGVCYLAKRLLETLRQKQQKLFEELNVTAKDEMCVQIAALCHELGQGPMSHLYQDLFINRPTKHDPWKHINASIEMFDYLIEQNRERLVDDFELWDLDISADSDDMIFIKELMYGGPLPGHELRGRPSPHHQFLYEIVSNQQSGIDVDKMDYIARDCHALGMPHSFDWQRFMSFSMLIKEPIASGQVHICPREKEAADLYELFQVRDKLCRAAYQHKTKRAIEYMMTEALKKADPHIKLTSCNGPRSVRMSEAITDMCALTELTDEIFWAIKYIPSSSLATPEETVEEAKTREQDLKEARELLERVERRDLYQCIGRTLPIDTKQEKVRKLLEEFNRSGLTDNDTRQQSLNDIRFSEIMTVRSSQQPVETIPQELVAMLNRSDCPIQPTDMLVDIIKFNYGKGSENPIDEVWFYRKDHAHEPKAVRVKREQVSEMLPTVFEECEIRLYLKKKVDKELKEELRRVFNEYCEHHGFRTPAGANGSHSS